MQVNANQEVFSPPKSLVERKTSHVRSFEEYANTYERSLTDSDAFWAEVASQQIDFFQPYSRVQSGSFERGDVVWFANGRLNASYNAIDRHLPKRADQVAIIYEGDDPSDIRRITYQELYNEVCRFANALKTLGIRKGDCVCIYMPMVPEAAYAMLACSRIGAPHSVVFAGFSTEALRERIVDCHAKIVITADYSIRGGKIIPLKSTVDSALQHCSGVKNVLVYRFTSGETNFVVSRDIYLDEIMAQQRPYCPPEPMDSEDILFMLYTSGSTGRPKGIAHTTAGYCVWTSYTHKNVFDYQEGDVYACVADVGWITGHSYIVYGPLINGSTTLMFQSTPLFPDCGRYWDLIQRHKINIFYTAPTAIRALMRLGSEPVAKYDLSSLRVLGTVGEPINPEAWRWYYNVVGRGNCAVIDTYWQTETGGIMVTSLPAATPTKPGSASFPFFGIEVAIRDAHTGAKLEGNGVSGVLTIERPWPGMARTIHGDHKRYLNVYMTAYKGSYFSGDGAVRDSDGFYWITGRVDDVLNVSGHRIGSAELESALVTHSLVAEAAVVGRPHSVKGESLFAYVILVSGIEQEQYPELILHLKQKVRQTVGAFATPDEIVITPALPKTRSGKIMRRLLRKIASREFNPEGFGDTSTLLDPTVVENLINEVMQLPAIE